MTGHARGVFDRLLGPPQIGPKFLGRLLVDESMPVTVAGQLVAGGVNVAHELRKTIGHPAQDEKGAADAARGQQVEQPLRVGDDAALKIAPLAARNHALERGDLKIVLHVYGKGV